jgi:hypothetical protein
VRHVTTVSEVRPVGPAEDAPIPTTVEGPGAPPGPTAVADLDELHRVSRDLEARPAAGAARAAIEWAADRFGTGLVLAASFQDCVVIDLAVQVDPAIEVTFLDTGYHFAETLWYVEQVRRRYDLNLRVVGADVPPDDRWLTDTDACCAARKVAPLAAALQGRAAWMSGLRRLRRRTGPGEGEPHRHVVRRRRRRPRRGPGPPGAPPRRPRVPLHRVLALHPPGRHRCRPPGRPLGGQRQVGVRTPRLSPGPPGNISPCRRPPHPVAPGGPT